MNTRENSMAILHYQNYDKMPVVHFGYWGETLEKWKREGKFKDGEDVSAKFGFDYEWGACFGANHTFAYPIESKVIEDLGDGWVITQNGSGLIEKKRNGVDSIPATVGTLLKDREAWETIYKPRLQWSENRVDMNWLNTNKEYLRTFTERPIGYHAGSLYGCIRDMLGVENLAYLQVDDEDLYIEIINTIGEIAYKNAELVIKSGVKFDFIHFWEDICFKNGPLVNPEVFDEYVVPHYKRITDLFRSVGTDLASLDCDGCIDKLVPLWLKGGVNVMFPIEVGTWEAEIAPWREKYGKEVLGVGGMDKRVFAQNYAAVDREVERLKRLIDLGGYIPCPDHRIAPDAIFENVQYYCDKMQNLKI